MTPIQMMTRPIPVTAIQWDGRNVQALMDFLEGSDVEVRIQGGVVRFVTGESSRVLIDGQWVLDNHGVIQLVEPEQLEKYFTVVDPNQPNVTAFADLMKERLDENVKANWDSTDPDELREDFKRNSDQAVTGSLISLVDVANYAMMLHQRGDGT